jgi:D-alanyl-D-alanine endopeptidase (penicillin-binding protein 7)
LKRYLHSLAATILALALVPAGVHAAPNKRIAKKEPVSVVKKARVSKTFAAGKSESKVVAKSRRSVVVRAEPPPRPSFGQLAGLRGTQDDLDLASSVALVIDQDTREVLVRKNDSAVLPIASITKLMTGLIISEAKLPMEESITITQDDVDTEKGSSSRLKVGSTLSRGELMHLSLMSSENRAAHALGRTYPGGMSAFVEAMNTKARLLGMSDTRYVEPTGLSSRNQSSAQDLARLVATASNDRMLSELSTSHGHVVEVGNRTLQYNNTNRLVKNPQWDVTLQKTGYISEAGQCLVMATKVAGRKLIMVFLDSAGKLSRIADAERVRKFIETHQPTAAPVLPTGGNVIIRQVNG